MKEPRFSLQVSDGPLVAAALHAGHSVRENLALQFAISDADRLQEEDPGTDLLASIAPTTIISHISRFEHDLNRPREKAVYRLPEDAWGLTVWRDPLPEPLLTESLHYYDEFYLAVRNLLTDNLKREGKLLLLDMHSYNHRRDGADQPPADVAGNPNIEIDTTEIGRVHYGDLIDRLITDLRSQTICGKLLDVRENVRFAGPGHFARWVQMDFPKDVCVVSIEIKKFYMNEWTGEIDFNILKNVRAAIASTLPGLLELLAAK
jgi:hypothetical protein